jgi:hypothetical protein
MRIAVLLVCVVATGAIFWLVASRSLSLLLDRAHLVRLSAVTVQQVRYDNGTFEVAGSRLDTMTTGTIPSGLGASARSAGRAVLTYQGKSFPCGPGRSLSTPGGLPDILFTPDPGDTVTFINERSHLSWPTPFETNFVTGSVPSWKRNSYCRLTWEKRSRARLEIVWRIEQAWFNEGGWRPKTMEFVYSGLVRVTIVEASDLIAAAVEYLVRTHHWDRSLYRLEDRGPSGDRRGEIIAAIHRDDERGTAPGSGLSLQLLLDYDSRKVTREIAFQ